MSEQNRDSRVTSGKRKVWSMWARRAKKTMRISDLEIKKLIDSGLGKAAHSPYRDAEGNVSEIDGMLVQEITGAVMAMPDRDEAIAELRAKVEAGEYNPTGEEIASAMIKRAIADRVR